MVKKHIALLCLVAIGMLSLGIVNVQAQDADEADQPYWYVNFFTVDWNKADSLAKLWEITEPVRELQKENGEILAWMGLMHDTGNEQNVVIMTKYPSWSAMRAESDAFETVFSNAAERARLNDGFSWVYEGGAHQDVIYSESPGSVMPSPEDTTTGAYWYASFYEVPWARMDSLQTLWELTADVPAEAKRNGSILGAIGLVHHTGVQQANVVTLTKFPSWDAMESRSWGGAFRTVVPDDARRSELNAGFGHVYSDAPHYDVIYVQPGQ